MRPASFGSRERAGVIPPARATGHTLAGRKRVPCDAEVFRSDRNCQPTIDDRAFIHRLSNAERDLSRACKLAESLDHKRCAQEEA